MARIRGLPSNARLPWVLVVALVALHVPGCAGQATEIRPDATVSTPMPQPPSGGRAYRATADTYAKPQTPIDSLELVGYLGPGRVTALAVQQGLAYVGFGIQMAVVDLSDTQNPQRLGYLVLPGYVVDVAVSREAVYAVTVGSAGLHVIDASDPASPVLLDTLLAGFPTDGVVVAGHYAYATDGRFHVLDITYPTAPQEVGSCDFSGEPPMISGKVEAVADGHAYTIYHGGSTQSGGLRIVDISDPTAPEQAGHLGLVGWPYHLVVEGDYAYLLSGYGNPHLTVVDISDPEHPEEVPLDPARPWLGWSLAAQGGVLLLGRPGPADGPDGLQVLDITDPAHPELLGTYEGIPRAPTEIVFDGSLATIATGEGLVILDVSDPSAPSLAGTFRPEALPLPEEDVAVRDPYAYVAAGGEGLRIVDISDPANPGIVGGTRTGGHAWAVALAVSHAYVADEYNGLRIIDITDPRQPVGTGHYDLPGRHEFFHAVEIRDHCAYIADGSLTATGLRIVDITDPANPSELSYWPLTAESDRIPPPRVEDVAVMCDDELGCTAYVAAGTGGLRLVDVSDPAAPVEIGSHTTPGLADNLVVEGTMAYLVDGDLRVLNVSDPAAIVEVGFYDAPDSAETPYVAVQGPYAYLSGGGLRVLDFSELGAPREVIGHPLPSGKVAVSGATILVAGAGLFILHSCSTPSENRAPELGN